MAKQYSSSSTITTNCRTSASPSKTATKKKQQQQQQQQILNDESYIGRRIAKIYSNTIYYGTILLNINPNIVYP